jgi:hypothetical protein
MLKLHSNLKYQILKYPISQFQDLRDLQAIQVLKDPGAKEGSVEKREILVQRVSQESLVKMDRMEKLIYQFIIKMLVGPNIILYIQKGLL